MNGIRLIILILVLFWKCTLVLSFVRTACQRDINSNHILRGTSSRHRHMIRIRRMDNNENDDPYLPIWIEIKNLLPAIVTGAYNDQIGNSNARGAIYNLIVVRFPTIVIGLWFAQHIAQGGGMSMDFGFGPVEVSETAIAFAVFLILRPSNWP